MLAPFHPPSPPLPRPPSPPRPDPQVLRGGGHITEGDGEFEQDRPSHSIDGILGEHHLNCDGDADGDGCPRHGIIWYR